MRAALPLIIFLPTYGILCAGLELGGALLFSSPAAFWLIAAAPWIWWMHESGFSGLSGFRSSLAVFTRLCLVGVFVILLAEPRAVRRSDILSLVYALDVSDSIGEEATDRALEYIVATALKKPPADEAGLVVFGGSAAVEMPPRITFPFEVINSRVPRDASDLARGLSLAAAVLPEENSGRIVLVSDGSQTEGDVGAAIRELKARRIAVDILRIDYEYEHEVWLEKMELPRNVKLGETYEAAVVLSSKQAGEGALTLRENDEVVFRETVQFNAGKNRYKLPLYLRAPGYYEYVATIEPEAGKDGWEENNVATGYIHLQGEGKVLLVTDPQGDVRDWAALLAALKEAERLTEVRQAFEFPRDSMSLMPYDAIIFANVAANDFDPVQLQAVRDAVYNLGIGFLMIGGQNSFGPGGYRRSPIEETLPVTMDIKQRKVLPKGALAIILHTCEFAQGNTWGKRIAKEAMRVLSAQDEVGVLVYTWNNQTSGAQWLFPLTPASEYDRLVPLINQAQIGDMPSFATTMQLGLAGLQKSDAAAKHMIVISDGDPSPPAPALVNEFVNSQISISTVAINPHGGNDISIMRSIASTTGGRYYFPQDPAVLPSIFIKEATTLRRSMIQNVTFPPESEFPSPILKGIDSLPQLHGYVLTSPKGRARTILVNGAAEDRDPVLATWRFGVGSSAAFTSDLSVNWGRTWVEWDKYRAFVSQLMTDVSRVKRTSFLHARTFASGNLGVVVVEDHHPDGGFLDIVAEVAGPRREQTVTVKQVSPRLYQGEFSLTGRGRYQVVLAGTGADRNEVVVDGFTVPYSPEYLRFRSDPIVLKRLAAETGGRVLSGTESGEEIYGVERVAQQSSRSVIDWFLVALAILLPLDVGIRRIQLDWQVVREWLGLGGKRESTATMGALLKRKREVDTSLDESKGERPATPVRPARMRTTTKTETTPKTGEADVEPPKPESTTTTGRLLAKKKKWKSEEGG